MGTSCLKIICCYLSLDPRRRAGRVQGGSCCDSPDGVSGVLQEPARYAQGDTHAAGMWAHEVASSARQFALIVVHVSCLAVVSFSPTNVPTHFRYILLCSPLSRVVCNEPCVVLDAHPCCRLERRGSRDRRSRYTLYTLCFVVFLLFCHLRAAKFLRKTSSLKQRRWWWWWWWQRLRVSRLETNTPTALILSAQHDGCVWSA